MGSFDGWSRGVSMSPEYDGFSTKFSTTLRLKPGRYYTYPLFNSHICMILWILFLMSIYHFRVTIRYREWVLVREGFAFFIIHLTIPRILDPRLVSGPSSEWGVIASKSMRVVTAPSAQCALMGRAYWQRDQVPCLSVPIDPHDSL